MSEQSNPAAIPDRGAPASPPKPTTIPTVSAPVGSLEGLPLAQARVEAPEPSGRPERQPTPRQATHRFCVECQGSALQANLCYTQTCDLWWHRKGKYDPAAPHTPCKSIRRRCLDCCSGVPSAVRTCQCVECALHPFRMGRNPNIPRRKTGEA